MRMSKFKQAGVAPVLVLVLVLGVTLIIAGCTGRKGQLAPADFYRSKSLDFSVTTTAGNMYSAILSLQPAMQKHLGTTVALTERPAGGGLEGLNHVYNAPPEGTSFGLMGVASLVMNLMFSPEAVKYEVDKYSYIFGFPRNDPMLMYVGENSAYTTVQALKAGKKLVLGGTAPSSVYTIGAVAVIEILGLDAKVLPGVKGGSSGIALGTKQGELVGATMASSQYETYKGTLKPIFVLGTKRSSAFPNLPALAELIDVKSLSQTQRQLLELGDTIFPIDRAVFTSPNVPEDRLKFLRDTFMQKIIPDARSDLEKAFAIPTRLEEFVPGDTVAKSAVTQFKGKAEAERIIRQILDKYRL